MAQGCATAAPGMSGTELRRVATESLQQLPAFPRVEDLRHCLRNVVTYLSAVPKDSAMRAKSEWLKVALRTNLSALPLSSFNDDDARLEAEGWSLDHRDDLLLLNVHP